MYQLFIPGFSRGLIEPTNLLPRGVIITSNKNHKAPSVPRVSVLNQSLLGPRTEPSLLSNQPLRFCFLQRVGTSSVLFLFQPFFTHLSAGIFNHLPSAFE